MTLMFRGLPACPCQVRWIPAFESELIGQGVLPVGGSLHLYQLIGGAAASGGTHATGGAFDFQHLGDEAVRIGRQMGADALWHRAVNWDGAGGIEHDHGVLRGCPENGPARYQIDAVDRGYNGLGRGGMGAPDDGPRPLSYRTWQEGIAWHREQVKARRRAALTAKILDAVTQRKKLTARIERWRAKRDAL